MLLEEIHLKILTANRNFFCMLPGFFCLFPAVGYAQESQNTLFSHFKQILDTSAPYTDSCGNTGKEQVSFVYRKTKEAGMEPIEEKKEDRKNQTGKEKGSGKSHKRQIVIGCLLILIAAAGGGGYYYLHHQTDVAQRTGRPDGMPQGNVDVIVASGTTSIGITEETFELEELDTELEIEEVYLASGDEVETGSKILKVSEESIEKARKELTRKAEQARLLYRQGVVNQQISAIEAKKTCDVALVESEYAESDYNSSLEEAQKEIDDLTEKLEDAKELYEEYYDGVYSVC